MYPNRFKLREEGALKFQLLKNAYKSPQAKDIERMTNLPVSGFEFCFYLNNQTF